MEKVNKYNIWKDTYQNYNQCLVRLLMFFLISLFSFFIH